MPLSRRVQGASLITNLCLRAFTRPRVGLPVGERRMKCINVTNLNRNPGERTRISYFAALPAATYAALRKESRMKSTEATFFDRKSGAGEGPAVRPGSRKKVWVSLVLGPTPLRVCSRSLLEHSRAKLHRRMVLPPTPVRLLSLPAYAFSRRPALS